LGAYDTVLYCTVRLRDVFAFHQWRMWMGYLRIGLPRLRHWGTHQG